MALFEPGEVSISEKAAALLKSANISADDLLLRHQNGDWSDEDEAGQQENHYRATNRLIITAEYRITDEQPIWIRTADDRTWTHISLPDELEQHELDINEGYARWAVNYDTINNPLIVVEEPIVRHYLAQLNLKTILDAGTGTGRYALKLAEQGAYVVGVDQSMEMMTVARQQFVNTEKQIGLVNALLNKPLPLADHTFDGVVCSLVLSHVAELDFVIYEFARVLKPGGHCVISMFHPAGIASGWRTSFDAPGGVYRLPNVQRTRADYVNALLKSGFTIHDVVDCKVKDVPPEHFAPAVFKALAERELCLIVTGQLPG